MYHPSRLLRGCNLPGAPELASALTKLGTPRIWDASCWNGTSHRKGIWVWDPNVLVIAGSGSGEADGFMGLLEAILGSAGQLQDFQDFVNRYHEGLPHEGYSSQEVLNRYQQVAPQIPAEDYERAAQEGVSTNVSSTARGVPAKSPAADPGPEHRIARRPRSRYAG